MRKRGRPIGARVIEVCEILEKTGPEPAITVKEWSESSLAAIHNYCRRAVLYGLATTDKTAFPQEYAVRPDWRERLEVHERTGMFTPKPIRLPRVASVWELGTRTGA